MEVITMKRSQNVSTKRVDVITKVDLRNVANAGLIVQEKSNMYLSKEKGLMLGLVIRTKDNTTGVTSLITGLPENKYTRGLEGIEGVLSIGNSTHTFTKENRFVDKFITVSMDKKSSQTYAKEALYVDLERNIIALPIVNKDGETSYTNIVTGKKVKADRLSKYVLALATASGLREKRQLFNSVYVKLEGNEKVSDVLNARCHNIIKHANKNMTKGQAAKFMTRPGLAWTASKSFGSINAMARLNGVFDLEFNRDVFDGVAYMDAQDIAERFQISPIEAVRLALQCRPGGVIKVQIKVLPSKTFSELLESYRKEGKVTEYGNGTPTLIFDNNAIKANIDLDNIELEVLAMGKTSEVGLSKQILEKVILEATTMDRENGDTTNLERVKEYVLGLGKSTIIDLIAELIAPSGKVSPDMNYVYDVINAKGLRTVPGAKKTAVQNVLRRIAKAIDKLAFSDKNIFYSVIYTDTAQLFGHKLLNEGEVYYPKMKNETKKGVAVKYPSMGAKEFYSFTTVPFKEIAKRIKALDATDSLKEALLEEYRDMSKSLVVFPASRRVFDSCAGMDIDMDTIALIFSDVVVDMLHGKEEYVKLSAGEKKKTVKNEGLRNALANKASKGNGFAKAALETEHNPERDTFYSTMYSIPTTTNAKGIGELTFDNNKTIAIAIECLKGNFAPLELMLKENVGTIIPMTNSYKGLPVVQGVKQLNELSIDAMLAEMKNTKLTEENMIRMILDLNRCFRLYQETTIDAAKTGELVKIAVMCRTIMVKSLMSVSYVEETINGTRTFKIERNEKEIKDIVVTVDGVRQTMTPMVIADDMSLMQDELIEFAMDIMREAIEDYSLYSFKGLPTDKVEGTEQNGEVVYDMTGKLNMVVNTFNTKVPGALEVLFETKNIYNTLAADYNNASNRMDEEASEEEISILRNQFDMKMANISNTIEGLLSKFKGSTDRATANLRGSLMIAVGAMNRGLISPQSSNRFAFNIAPHYALSYALADDKYVCDCTVLYCADDLEGQIEVENGFGFNENGEVVLVVKESFKDRENGKAILNVARTEEGVVVTETKYVEKVEYDDTKAMMILDAEIANILDVNKEVVVDASGAPKVEVTCDAGKVLKAIEYGVVVKKTSKTTAEFSFMLNGEKRVLDIDPAKLKFSDARVGSTYKVSFGYVVNSYQGRVVLELTK
jgi:hypothetical protein